MSKPILSEVCFGRQAPEIVLVRLYINEGLVNMARDVNAGK